MNEDIVLKLPVEKIPVDVTVTKITRWKMGEDEVKKNSYEKKLSGFALVDIVAFYCHISHDEEHRELSAGCATAGSSINIRQFFIDLIMSYSDQEIQKAFEEMFL